MYMTDIDCFWNSLKDCFILRFDFCLFMKMTDGSQEALVKKLQEQNRQLKHSVAHVRTGLTPNNEPTIACKFEWPDQKKPEMLRGSDYPFLLPRLKL